MATYATAAPIAVARAGRATTRAAAGASASQPRPTGRGPERATRTRATAAAATSRPTAGSEMLGRVAIRANKHRRPRPRGSPGQRPTFDGESSHRGAQAPLHLPARSDPRRAGHLPPSALSRRARAARLARRPHLHPDQLHARDGARGLRRAALRPRGHRRRGPPLGLGVVGRAPLPRPPRAELRDLRRGRRDPRSDARPPRPHLGVLASPAGRDPRRGSCPRASAGRGCSRSAICGRSPPSRSGGCARRPGCIAPSTAPRSATPRRSEAVIVPTPGLAEPVRRQGAATTWVVPGAVFDGARAADVRARVRARAGRRARHLPVPLPRGARRRQRAADAARGGRAAGGRRADVVRRHRRRQRPRPARAGGRAARPGAVPDPPPGRQGARAGPPRGERRLPASPAPRSAVRGRAALQGPRVPRRAPSVHHHRARGPGAPGDRERRGLRAVARAPDRRAAALGGHGARRAPTARRGRLPVRDRELLAGGQRQTGSRRPCFRPSRPRMARWTRGGDPSQAAWTLPPARPRPRPSPARAG